MAYLFVDKKIRAYQSTYLPDRKSRGKLLEKGVRIPGTGMCFDTHIPKSVLTFFHRKVKAEFETVSYMISVVHAAVSGLVCVYDHPTLPWC
jgi:hypothetical protein